MHPKMFKTAHKIADELGEVTKAAGTTLTLLFVTVMILGVATVALSVAVSHLITENGDGA